MTLIGIRIRTMSRENVQSVPMWPVGMPLEINMIGSPVCQNEYQNHLQTTQKSHDHASGGNGLIGDVRFMIFDGDVPRLNHLTTQQDKSKEEALSIVKTAVKEEGMEIDGIEVEERLDLSASRNAVDSRAKEEIDLSRDTL